METSTETGTLTTESPPDDDVRAVTEFERPEPGEREPTLVEELADKPPEEITPEEEAEGLAWALESFESIGTEADLGFVLATLEVNVAAPGQGKKWVKWAIRPVTSERIDELRRGHQVPSGNRREQRAGRTDLRMSAFNAALVWEATIEPNPDELLRIARSKGVASGGEVISWLFRHKPLLVDQLAGRVLEAAGGDEDDVRDAAEVRAAGN